MEHRRVEAPSQFSAFVSYNHGDRSLAAKLQRRLERYRFPRPVAHMAAAVRLKPVFRDHGDLSAAADLSDALRAALNQSEFLLVVCTPNTPKSEWVGREIQYFRNTHGDACILAALFDGNSATAFHPALLQGSDGKTAQPLAADFRRGGDGRLALLKLIAVMAHVPLDALVRRDARRRRRQLLALIVGTTAAALAAAALIVIAVHARADTLRERDRNAAAVSRQLTDLSQALDPVGRPGLMDSALKSVLPFYQGRNPKSLTVQELLNLVQASQKKSEVEQGRGNYAAARQAATAANAITSKLIAAYPRDDRVILAHARSAFWMGSSDRLLGDRRGAETGFRRYAALAGQLTRADRANLDWKAELADADTCLGMLALQDNLNPELARKWFTDAQSQLAAVHARRPKDREVLANIADGEAWLADSDRLSGDYPGSLNERRAQLKVLDGLLRDSGDARYMSYRIGAMIGIARTQFAQGRYGNALRQLDAAHREGVALANAAQDNNAFANQRRMIEVLRVQIWLGLPARERPAHDVIITTLGDCDREWRKPHNEGLATFCSLESARAALANGNREAARRAVSIIHDRGVMHANFLSGLGRLDLRKDTDSIERDLNIVL